MSDEGTSLGDDYECPEGCGAVLESPTDLQAHRKMCDGDGVPDGYEKDGTPENFSGFETANNMSQNDTNANAEEQNTEPSGEVAEAMDGASDNMVEESVGSNYDVAWFETPGVYLATDGATAIYRVDLAAEGGPEKRKIAEYDPVIHECILRHHDSPQLEHGIIESYGRTINEFHSLHREARDLLNSAEAALEGAEEANVKARSAQADAEHEAAQSGVSDTVESEMPDTVANDDVAYSSEVDAEDATAELRDAFNDAGIGGINVKENGGLVWLNVSPDAPEKVAGNDTWQMVLQNPDQVIWTPDGSNGNEAHDWAEYAPGQYYQNCIKPEDVDQYVEEVLGVFL